MITLLIWCDCWGCPPEAHSYFIRTIPAASPHDRWLNLGNTERKCKPIMLASCTYSKGSKRPRTVSADRGGARSSARRLRSSVPTLHHTESLWRGFGGLQCSVLLQTTCNSRNNVVRFSGLRDVKTLGFLSLALSLRAFSSPENGYAIAMILLPYVGVLSMTERKQLTKPPSRQVSSRTIRLA